VARLLFIEAKYSIEGRSPPALKGLIKEKPSKRGSLETRAARGRPLLS
jgi:hypothetical protein